MNDTAAPLLEVRSATKRFPGVVALSNVDLTVMRGEVLAVIGENGAGKSTLMKILAGVESLDEGQIRFDGRPVSIDGVDDALRLGISLIHQELNLADNLDVGSNVFLGREPRHYGWIDRRSIERQSAELLRQIGLDVLPRRLVSTLPIGQQQLVEIAKALSTNARLLIMDEPTSSLSQRETETLFDTVRALRAKGVCVVYISHRLGEVGALADRVVVLRDGKNAGELARDEIDRDAMVRLMVGRDVSQFYERTPLPPGEPALEVEDLVSPAYPAHRVSLTVRTGEIVGIAGLVGSGRTEMLEALFGVRRTLGGHVKVAGQTHRFRSPADAIAAGMALVPEDRKQQGLFLEMALADNVSIAGLRRYRRAGLFRNAARERRDADEMIARLAIKTPSIRQPVGLLSGGNQQKVVLAKWLALEPKVLLLDEPTRGIDVGAKHEIYRLMDRLADSGVAVLFVSSEMEEILGMSDRTLVMHEGRIAGELARDQLSEEAVMRLATGSEMAVAGAESDS